MTAAAAIPPALLNDPRVPWTVRRRLADQAALAARAATAQQPRPPRRTRALAECGTQSARDRHRRKRESCPACRVVDGRTIPLPRPKREPKPKPPTVRKPRPLAPCGTESARRRHRRYEELCAACGVTELGPVAVKLAPCGTDSARRRHRFHGETCEACRRSNRKRVDRAPCGTKDARARHRRNGETWCEACGGPTLLRPASAKPRRPRT